MIELITYEGEDYPKFQAEGNAAQYAIPYAKNFCHGNGVDIGCMKREWAFPGAYCIDIDFPDDWHAMNIPDELDYIFSSHCLEHLDNYVEAMEYWYEQLNRGGVLFLYLPDYSQKYWRPWNNKKHRHAFTVQMIADLMVSLGYEPVISSGIDMNSSFMIVGEK